MKTGKVLLSSRFWTAATFLVGVMPLWLSSTEMWDGVVGIHALASRDWTVINTWLLDSNWYLTFGLFLLADDLQVLTGLPYWIFFKLWLTLLIAGIAVEVYRLAVRVFEIPASLALWLPPLVFSFPIWYVFFSYTSMSGHLTCVWLALIGYRLLYGNSMRSRATGAGLLTMSFQLASNGPFILVLEFSQWLLSRDKASWRYGRSALILFLALAVFAATRVIWPPVGTYVGYNRLLNPTQLANWVSYAKYASFFATWLVLLVPMVLGLWWTAARHGCSAKDIRLVLLQRWKTMAVFTVLTLAACAPYIAVGLGSPLFTSSLTASSSVSAALANNSATGPVSVWYGGWGARHLVLMMIPVVVFAGWLAYTAHQLMQAKTKELITHSSGSFIFMIAVGLAFGIPGHWAKLQRLAKQQSIVESLASLPPPPPGRIDLLLDKREDYLSYIYETNDLLRKAYKSTHWAALMLPEVPAIQAWGDDHRRLTLDQPEKNRHTIAKLNVMEDYAWADYCKTVARIELPTFSLWDVLWRAEHSPQQLPKTQIIPLSSTCAGADKFWL